MQGFLNIWPTSVLSGAHAPPMDNFESYVALFPGLMVAFMVKMMNQPVACVLVPDLSLLAYLTKVHSSLACHLEYFLFHGYVFLM